MNNLVSIVIPTRNSGQFLENCLKSVKSQTYKNIEIIIVDGKSTDNTIEIAKKYECKIYILVPKVRKGAYDASIKRNYGAKKGKGIYVYWLDADMELPKNIVEEAVNICKKGADAVILPEDSFGTGIWAKAKNLERKCYWGDGMVESPRFVKHPVWDAIGGLDESLGAGGDDIDLHFRILENGYKVTRSKNIVRHNEGHLKISKLFKKRFMYGRDIVNSFYKRPKASVVSYFPIRMSYLRNIKLFLHRPIDTGIFIVMRTIEYSAGILGFFYSLIDNSQYMQTIKTKKHRNKWKAKTKYSYSKFKI